MYKQRFKSKWLKKWINENVDDDWTKNKWVKKKYIHETHTHTQTWMHLFDSEILSQTLADFFLLLWMLVHFSFESRVLLCRIHFSIRLFIDVDWCTIHTWCTKWKKSGNDLCVIVKLNPTITMLLLLLFIYEIQFAVKVFVFLFIRVGQCVNVSYTMA